jgi:predicted nuclease with RNAse H fold
MRLAQALRERGAEVIESYPGAAQDIMRIPRKKSSLDDLRYGLAAFGLRGKFLDGEASHDELDAITSAVVGYFYLTGDVEALGNPSEDYLIIPLPTLAARPDTPEAAAFEHALEVAVR